MDRTFKVALARFLAQALPGVTPGFSPETLKRGDYALHPAAPLAYVSRDAGSRRQFIAFVPVTGGSGSRFTVECGWFSQPPVPVATADTAELIRKSRSTSSILLDAFATRLFWLCEDRGNAEHVWDLFSPEVWQPGIEPFSAFAARQTFAAFDEGMRIRLAGGVTAEYAASQARLVGGDCLACIRAWALPFLDRNIGQGAG